MGAFFRYDIIDTKTTGFAFLLILSCWRILLFRSPALQYAGTDRLQIVGVGSLHINGPLEMVTSSCISVKPFGVASICDWVTLCVPLLVKRRSRPKKEKQRFSRRKLK